MPQIRRSGYTTSYEEMLYFLNRFVSSSFGRLRYVGGGGLMIVHVRTLGLPEAKHSDKEAARLLTESAPERVQHCQDLLRLLCDELNAPLYLFDLSADAVEDFQRNLVLLELARGMSPQMRTSFVSVTALEANEWLARWNPGLRLYVDERLEGKSLWRNPIRRNPTPSQVKERFTPVMKELLVEKFGSEKVIPGGHAFKEHMVDFSAAISKLRSRNRPEAKKVIPVRVIYTDGMIDLSPAVRDWNAPLFAAGRIDRAVELYVITEPS